MAEKINLSQQTLTSRDFNKIVNREFTTFSDSVVEEVFTVEDFFVQYERLFYEIPAEGEFDSHEYLIKRSSELVDLETNGTDIQPLLDEISSLREQLLSANTQIIELETQLSLSSTNNR